MARQLLIPLKQRTRQHVISDLSVHYVEGFILEAGRSAPRGRRRFRSSGDGICLPQPLPACEDTTNTVVQEGGWQLTAGVILPVAKSLYLCDGHLGFSSRK